MRSESQLYEVHGDDCVECAAEDHGCRHVREEALVHEVALGRPVMGAVVAHKILVLNAVLGERGVEVMQSHTRSVPHPARRVSRSNGGCRTRGCRVEKLRSAIE